MLVRIRDYQAGLFEIAMKGSGIQYEVVDENEMKREIEREYDRMNEDYEPITRFFRD